MPVDATPASDAAPVNEIINAEQINSQMLMEADKAFQENIDQHELRMTRLSICQGTTKEIGNQVAGYMLGQIISSATREILSKFGPPPWLVAKGVSSPAPVHYLPVVIVMKLPSEHVEWVPKDEQKEGESPIRFKSLDPRHPRVVAGIYRTQGGTFDPGPNNNAPPITTGINYLVLPFDEVTKQVREGFAINTFARTSAPTGSALTTLISNRRVQKQFPWDCVYYLYTAPKKTRKGTTQVYQVAFGGLVKDICPDLHSMVMNMAVMLSKPGSGRQLQETMLNAAELSPDSDESHVPDTGGDALDHQVAGAGSAEADDAFGDGSAKQGF